MCIPTANLFHWYDVKVRMRVLNLGKVSSVPKLNEEKAIETGAQLLSEMIILGIAAGVLIFEYVRSSEKEEAKMEAAEAEKRALLDRVDNLELTLEKQSVQIKTLTQMSNHLDDQLIKVKSPVAVLKKVFQTEAEAKAEAEANSKVKEPQYTGTFSEVEDRQRQAGIRGGHSASEDGSPANVAYFFSEDDFISRPPVISKGLVTSAVDYYLDGCQED